MSKNQFIKVIYKSFRNLTVIQNVNFMKCISRFAYNYEVEAMFVFNQKVSKKEESFL